MKRDSNIQKSKTIFWDYNLKKTDLKNPKVKIWWLNRKLRFGDLSNIQKIDLNKYFSKLDINPSLKELLKNYLAKYA